MAKTIKNISESRHLRPKIFRGLIFGLIFSASFYFYFVGSAVSETIKADKKITVISQLENKKMALEKKYMNIISNVDLDLAVNKGFVEQPKEVVYATRYDTVAQR